MDYGTEALTDLCAALRDMVELQALVAEADAVSPRYDSTYYGADDDYDEN